MGGKKREIQHDIITLWPEGRSDAVTFGMSVECLQKFKPRVLYIAFGETDDWAHQRRYDRYLDYIHVFDSYLKRLWTLLQSMDEYRNNTTLIITTDHGRVRRIALPSSRETAGATGVESSSRG